MAHSLAWTLAFALPIFMLSAISVYINLRTRLRCVFSCLDDKSKLLVIGKRELLAFSERKRTRTLILNLLLSLIWAVACAVTLFQVRQLCSACCAICLCASQGALVLTTLQTISSYKPLPLLVPAACGGLALFAGWNAIYAVLLALGPGEK